MSTSFTSPRLRACLRPVVIGASLTLAASVAYAPALMAQADSPAGISATDGDTFTLNLKEADITTLIATVSEVTGRNFVVDPRVKGDVTVLSNQSMTPDELYQTFLSVLDVHGFSAIPSGEVTKIIPQINAKQDGGFGGSGTVTNENVVTKVLHVDNVPADQLVPILRPLVPQYGHLAAYSASNSLVISDREANVARLTQIVRRIDANGVSSVDQVQLTNANASDVAEAIGKLQGGDQKSATNVVALDRTNSVLVSGSPRERAKLRDVIKRMDTKSQEAGDTAVIYLNYADAETLAPVLQAYATGQSYSSGNSRNRGLTSTGGGFGSNNSGGFGGSNNNSGFGNNRGGINRQRNNSGGGVQGISGGEDSDVAVIAESGANALIIHAPADKMSKIKHIIEKLDIRRGQVLVEGIIAEIGIQQSKNLGINLAALKDGGPAAASILNSSTLSAVTDAASSGTPLNLIQQGLNVALGSTNGEVNFALLVNALSNNVDTNVLSTPSLITRDNEEAQIRVGQRVPFVTGSFTTGASGGGNGVNPFQTVDREDVGLQLAFIPQISAGDTIQLTIDEEVSSIAPSAQQSQSDAGLITNSRTLQTAVEVKNGQILVLGGLIDNNLNVTRNKVPVLGDIPLLGGLFRYNAVDRTKRNLLNFIRPTILRGDGQSAAYSAEKYRYLRSLQLQQTQQRLPLMGNEERRPQLPDINNFKGGTNSSARFNDTGADDLGQPQRALPGSPARENSKRRGDSF